MDFFRDKARFFSIAGTRNQTNAFASILSRPELLRTSPRIISNERVSRLKDGAAAAIILLESDDARVGVLLTIVPLESRLEIEAMVPNRDVGFVHPGQKAQIKVDTFNFTKYGLLHGEVLSVSRDAIVRDRPAERSTEKNLGSNGESSEPKGQELSFAARVSLDRSQMQVDDELINLTPGMAVTVEIKTGSRTVLGYLLSPLAKYGHDSLRER